MVQYVWGKFWVNNHAHVLSGKGISPELLRLALLRLDVTSALTGAVQPKLSMGNLKALKLRLPAHPEKLEAVLAELARVERLTTDTAATAAALRNTLLPLLLSGELRVREVEEQVGEAL
jgi:type I restriction enzyme S subunit